MPVTIYHRGAARSLRNIWACEELIENNSMKRADFKVVEVPNPTPKEYAKVHPGMRIPAADIDGTVIFESGAILEGTVEKYGNGTLGGKKEERLEYLQWMHFAETLTTGGRTPSIYGKAPGTANFTFDDVKKESDTRLENCFGAIEDAVASQDYLLKSGFSAVDVMTVWGLNAYINVFKIVDGSKFPKLMAYMNRCTSRPAYKRAWEYRNADPSRPQFGKL